MKKLNLEVIRIDGGTQPRERIDLDVVSEYREAVASLPPVVVFHDGSEYWLADGFHRWHAHKQAGMASIPADIRAGTQRDAILFSLGANHAHGLRRSNADKRKAVQTLLADKEWGDWSDRKIAEVCGVSHPFVAALRRPEVAEKQQANRVKSEATRVPKVETDSTRKVETDSTPPPKTAASSPEKRTLPPPPPAGAEALTDSDHLAEAQHTIRDLAAENDQLRDRLAVEAMDASEEEKTQAAETIRELRGRVVALEAENEALKVSRDTYMRESAERLKQISYWKSQAKKAGAVA